MRQTLGGMAALATLGHASVSASTSGMRYRRLGRTNLMVSELGIGCSPLGQRQARDVYLQNIGAVMRLGLERGINVFDTAPSYPGSEDAVGKAFQGVPRHSYLLCTKAEETRKEKIAAGLEASLKRLRADYVDILHEHAHYHKPEGAHDRLEFVEACQKLREQGKLRFFGASGHNPAVLAEYLRTGQFDTVMIPYNHLTRAAETLLFPVAQEHDVGVFAIKPLTGNYKPWDKRPGEDAKLDKLMKEFNARDYVSAALRFVLAHSSVACGVCGMERPQDVEENVATVRTSLQTADRGPLGTYAALFSFTYCRMCEWCLPCPRGVAVPDIQRFQMYATSYRQVDRARGLYAALPPEARADRCDGCGLCEARCPNGIYIRDKLKQAHEILC